MIQGRKIKYEYDKSTSFECRVTERNIFIYGMFWAGTLLLRDFDTPLISQDLRKWITIVFVFSFYIIYTGSYCGPFSYLETLLTRWSNMVSPDLPGYLPTILAEVKSNSVAPSSVHTALTRLCLPDPWTPAISTERTIGLDWCISLLSIGSTQ